ncbi:MAG: tetratricopeptide repeat protein [Rhodospirillaceae bacterium]|nr:tetratricopeptide repeat protein [Rhodospirillaceae bacterium]
MKRASTLGIALAFVLATGPAMAMGSKPDPEPKADSGYSAAERAVKAKQYEDAIKKLEAVLAKEPRNVDALNYLAYSHRELGRYDVAMGYYQKALALNANHRGANEYLGELYLKLGKMKEAQGQLAKLQRICGRGCEEYEALRTAIAKAGGKS